MEYLIIANWKEEFTRSDVLGWWDEFCMQYKPQSNVLVGIAPSFTEIGFVAQRVERGGILNVFLMAQDLSSRLEGKFTGEVSGLQLVEYGVKQVIIGHSERRRNFNDSNEIVNEKIKQAFVVGIKPVIVVSNLAQVRALDKTILFQGEYSIAYEPLDAIGGGHPANPKDVSAFLNMVRSELGENTRLIYGGSVDARDVSDHLADENISGFLVGTASLNARDFIGIINRIGKMTK